MKTIFENVISRGGYDLASMLAKIDAYHIEGKLTDAERDELYIRAKAAPKAQYDYDKEIEALWAAVRKLQNGDADIPADEWPEFVQPTGAHDAYNTGDQVTYKGVQYVCQLDNCVWAPDVYGWAEP